MLKRPKPDLERLLFFWQSLVLAGIFGILGQQFFISGLLLAASLSFLDRRTWTWGGGFIFILSFILGFTWANIQLQQALTQKSQSIPWYQEALNYNLPALTITGQVQKISKLPAKRWRITLTGVRHKDQMPLPGYLSLTWDEPPLNPLPGQMLTLTTRIYPVRGFNNSWNWRKNLVYDSQHIFWQASIKAERGKPQLNGQATLTSQWRDTLSQRIIQSSDFTSLGAGLNPALLFGDRSYLSLEQVELFTKAGLSHSLALSGQHLALVGLLAWAITSLITRVNPHILLTYPKQKLIALISLPLSISYLWLGNFPISLTRASLMLWLYLVYIFWNKSRLALDVIFLALTLMLFYQPLNLYDLGFELSFMAVLGIICLPWTKIQTSWKARLLWGIALVFASSLAAQLATLPITLNAFGYISCSSLLTNLIWLPILSFWILPWNFLALASAVCNIPILTNFCLNLSTLASTYFWYGLDLLNKYSLLDSIWSLRPTWPLAISFWLGLLILLAYRRWQTKRLLILFTLYSLCSLILYYQELSSNELQLRILDVGQGQAILIQYPGHNQGLIDAGGFFSNRFDTGQALVTPSLSYNKWPKLDFAALSHADSDHAKGLLFITKELEVKHFYSPKAMPDNPLWQQIQTNLQIKNIPHTTLKALDTIPLTQGYTLEVLAPGLNLQPKGNNGLILRLTYQQGDQIKGLALLPGDAELAYIKKLLKTNQNLQSEVLILPHHGSKTSLLQDFYLAIKPKLAIASVGSFNSYNLPSPQVQATLIDLNIPFLATSKQGEIILRWKNGIFKGFSSRQNN